MYIVSVDIHVTADSVAAFIAASRINSENTRREPGNLRFDIGQAVDDPQRFLFYEVYLSQEEFTKHQQTPHYHVWRAAVAPMMAVPRAGLRFTSVHPEHQPAAWAAGS